MEKGVNRRQFLAGVGLVGAMGATGMLTACAPSQSSPASTDAAAGEVGDTSGSVLAKSAETESSFKATAVGDGNETLDYDVVVVGGGTSGTCASLAAAQNGAKTMLIEKTETTGGLSSISVHVCGAQSKVQLDAGRTHTADDLYAMVRDWYKGTNNLALVREILDASGENIDWLVENGVSLTPQPEELVLQPKLERLRELAATMLGDDKLTPLAKKYEEAGGETMLNTRVVKLLAGEDGLSVSGVVCEKEDGTQVTLNAKAVILSAGSWSGNTDYFKDVIAHTDNYMVHSGNPVSLDNTGDGIYLAEEVGGMRWISVPFWHQIDFADLDGTPNIEMTNRYGMASLRYDPNLIWVNSEGTRFCDEGVAGTFAQRGATASSQGGDLWLIFDRGVLEDVDNNGSKPSVTSDVYIIPPKSGLLEMVEASVEAEEIYQADTLEELAELCGFDADEFTNSVEVYNDSVDKQYDRLYLKDPSFLTYKIGTPPYYAQRMIANNEGGAIGGVRVNRNLKVYDKESGKTFQNLFATGLNASGYFGLGTYIDLAGQTMCFATGSGRLAGIRAAEVATA